MADPPGQFDRARENLRRLDALLQHRARLGICVLLADVDCMSFSRLKELLAQTDGNLGAQLRKLEDAGYISVRKEFIKRKPVSWYSLTRRGNKALHAHLTAMEAIVKGTKTTRR